MKFQFEIAWTWTEVINASSQFFQLQINQVELTAVVVIVYPMI